MAELIAPIIAGAVSLAAAGASIWSSQRSLAKARDNARDLEQAKFDIEKIKQVAQKQDRIASYSEPLAQAAYDLQSRVFNILEKGFLSAFLVNGDERERRYALGSGLIM